MTTRRRFLGSAAALTGLAAVGLPRAGLAQDAGEGGPRPIHPGQHELPPLPYPYEALEPHIDADTLRLHHDKHHAAYVKGWNAAELALVEARQKNDFAEIGALEQQLAFHGSGHINHVLYWNNMKPAEGTPPRPGGELARLVGRDFGGLEAFQAQFQAAALKVEGNGWAALVYHPYFGRLYTVAILNHQNGILNGGVPILVCDVWEHAYYLKYRNARNDYLAAWWSVVNWAEAERRLGAARKAL